MVPIHLHPHSTWEIMEMEWSSLFHPDFLHRTRWRETSSRRRESGDPRRIPNLCGRVGSSHCCAAWCRKRGEPITQFVPPSSLQYDMEVVRNSGTAAGGGRVACLVSSKPSSKRGSERLTGGGAHASDRDDGRVEWPGALGGGEWMRMAWAFLQTMSFQTRRMG